VSTFEGILECVSRFPNVRVDVVRGDANSTVTDVTLVSVTFGNWLKYQGDFSNDRVRRFRARCNGLRGEEKRGEERRREEKRRDASIVPPKRGNQRQPFVPPTLDDVRSYCTERNNGVSPTKWMDHYIAKDWKIGRERMVDWRAAVRTWEHGEASVRPAMRVRTGRGRIERAKDAEYEAILKDMREHKEPLPIPTKDGFLKKSEEL